MSVKSLIVVILGLVILAGSSRDAFGQEDLSQKIVASRDYNDMDVHDAIADLFKEVQVSFSINPDVKGKVTVHFERISFEVALRNILRQVNADYRADGAVFQIVLRSEDTNRRWPGLNRTTQLEGPTFRRIKIRYADPVFGSMLGRSQGYQDYNMSPESSTIILSGVGGSIFRFQPSSFGSGSQIRYGS